MYMFCATDKMLLFPVSSTTSGLTIGWMLAEHLEVTSFSISYSNTNNTQCFTDTNDITDISASDTMYTLTDLQEHTEYSITVTAILRDGGKVTSSTISATLHNGK